MPIYNPDLQDPQLKEAQDWIYHAEPGDNRAPVQITMSPRGRTDDAIAVSAAFAVRTNHPTLKPVRNTDSPTRPGTVHAIAACTDPIAAPPTVTLHRDDTTVPETIYMPVLVYGDSQYDLEAKPDHQGIRLTPDHLHHILYPSIPAAMDIDLCQDWQDIKFQRDQLSHAISEKVTQQLGDPGAAYAAALTRHLGDFNPNLQAQDTPVVATYQRPGAGAFTVTYQTA